MKIDTEMCGERRGGRKWKHLDPLSGQRWIFNRHNAWVGCYWFIQNREIKNSKMTASDDIVFFFQFSLSISPSLQRPVKKGEKVLSRPPLMIGTDIEWSDEV